MGQIDKQKNPFTTALPVEIQDQHSELIDLYFCRTVLSTTSTSQIPLDGKSVNVTSVAGASVGDCIDISQNGHTMQGIITNITSLTITFSAPSDRVFTIGAIVEFGKWNMNVNGSVTPQIYHVSPPAGVQWDINRIIIGITGASAMDDGKFGSIPSLPNGVILRMKNGVTKNILQVSDNGGWRERSFDVAYADKAPAGTYGFGCRKAFNGQVNSGVAIRLDGDSGDELQMIIQDDLTGLTKMAIVAQGHQVV